MRKYYNIEITRDASRIVGQYLDIRLLAFKYSKKSLVCVEYTSGCTSYSNPFMIRVYGPIEIWADGYEVYVKRYG